MLIRQNGWRGGSRSAWDSGDHEIFVKYIRNTGEVVCAEVIIILWHVYDIVTVLCMKTLSISTGLNVCFAIVTRGLCVRSNP